MKCDVHFQKVSFFVDNFKMIYNHPSISFAHDKHKNSSAFSAYAGIPWNLGDNECSHNNLNLKAKNYILNGDNQTEHVEVDSNLN